MNKFNRAALNLFIDLKNINFLRVQLISKFQSSPPAMKYINETIINHVKNYNERLEHSFLNTTLMTAAYRDDQNSYDQLFCMNNDFVRALAIFISEDVMNSTRNNQLKSNDSYSVNDGLNASSSTLVSRQSQSILCDTDTRFVDDPKTYFGCDAITSTNGPYKKQVSRAVQVNPNSVTGLKFKSHSKTSSDSANIALGNMYFARRPPEIRDDVVGSLNRDRDAPQFRNQLDFPQGNMSCYESGKYDPRTCNPNESRGTPYVVPLPSPTRGLVSYPLGQSKSEGFSSAPNIPVLTPVHSINYKHLDNELRNKSDYIGLKPVLQTNSYGGFNPGNSLDAFKPANVIVGNGFSFTDNSDEVDNGSYNNKFTGESPEMQGTQVDKYLNTPYIQTMNAVRGPDGYSSDRPSVQQSTFNRGKYGRADYVTENFEGQKQIGSDKPSNNVKFWRDGYGFADNTNEYEMQHLLNKRTFRSKNAPNKQTGFNQGDEAKDQIPWYEKQLYNRYYERDVEESVGGFEKDCQVRGYGDDLKSLYCRVQTTECSKMPNKPQPGNYNQISGKPNWNFFN